jgi:signal transduction histidine kinase
VWGDGCGAIAPGGAASGRRPCEAPSQASCDAVQIQQVVLNLVRNAIDAMFAINLRHGKRIRVISQHDGEWVMVRIDDSGPGVSDEQTGVIFQPFHSTKREGMGMGLAICKTIIEDHDGSLGFVNRRGDDTGASFYFRIPRGTQL